MEIKTIVTIVLIAFIIGGLVWLQIKKRKDKK
jgi:cbb3-type cytochrome oxidase subunit 3